MSWFFAMARKGSTDHLRFGVPDTAPVKPTDLSAREISITLSMIYAVSFFEGRGTEAFWKYLWRLWSLFVGFFKPHKSMK